MMTDDDDDLLRAFPYPYIRLKKTLTDRNDYDTQ